MLGILWSALVTVLAVLPLAGVRRLRRWQMGRRGVVSVKLGAGQSRGSALLHSVYHLEALHDLARDPSVRAVVVELRGMIGGWATAQDVREALARVRAAGRLVVMHLDSASNREVFLASAADRVWMSPSGEVFLNGLGAQLTFFGDALSGLGVQVDLEAVGDFKSFGEAYTRSYPSHANRAQLTALLADLQDQLFDSIAEGRSLEPEAVRALAGAAPLSADEALAAGLIDGVAYPDQAREALEVLLDGPVRPVSFARYAWLARIERWLSRWGVRENRVAVVHLEGPIVHGAEAGGGGGQRIDADRVVPLLERLADDPSYRAAVLYVNSPGGSALASDLIARAVQRLGLKKPVVAACGDVSASGGYYLSAPASEVVARPGTITGSIGVVAGKLVIGGAAGRLGVHTEVIEAGPDSAMLSPWTPFSQGQRARLRRSMEQIYERFLAVASAGRRLPVDAIRPHAGGRVWTGRQALARGLVDQLGGLETAIDRACSLAGLPSSVPDHFRFPPPRFRVLSGLLRGGALADRLALGDLVDLGIGTLGNGAALPRMLRLAPGRALAMLPFDLDPR